MGVEKYQTDGDRTSGPGFGVSTHPLVLAQPYDGETHVWCSSTPCRTSSTQNPRVRERCFRRHARHSTSHLSSPNKTGIAQPPFAKTHWPDNVWLGVSVESGKQSDRIDHLRDIPAKVRFLLEPLLGPLDDIDLREIDWVIAGGESGPRYRPMEIGRGRGNRLRCRRPTRPSCWGRSDAQMLGRELDERTWDEYPRTRNVASIHQSVDCLALQGGPLHTGRRHSFGQTAPSSTRACREPNPTICPRRIHVDELARSRGDCE